ncbi:alpha,alpha-trehalose-phosphate synthase (UDP-forming) [Desulfolutivibrio sulfoxidireducens]|uniref:alpha,alpha-trehalose-phosphate synthase (UDP-forming) n=1 Tax=Desulfolutivibrio sulfoxidireducens TaxID=2773299 RepID=UPI00159CFD93|nr:trehalose-6-phosphate synthase [Desulfolutivibrio sulfoxidireducens]QLA15453.1 trehalose-6-phosphate synthase [Desulfolutivibrio sulfoxidireducens]QLA19052.1 trehalose-6-phosphate synthase [Desulfolutivibrio sulfoxidireducens]
MHQNAAKKRFVVVSNRLPISIARDRNGGLIASQGAGGLVTALAPVLKNRGGIWLGWPGTSEEGVMDMCRSFSREAGYILWPVALSDADVEGFYRGFSNEILWPLFHEFQTPCNFLPEYWAAYRAANLKFAQATATMALEEDFIWVHDYHLMLVASMLKELGKTSRVGFFLHIPFPPADIFLKIPWRRQLLEALLEYDLIGFQTLRDMRNFIESVKRVYPSAVRKGRGQVTTLTANGRSPRIGSFPIGIDYHAFAKAAGQPERAKAARDIRAAFGDRFLLFGADRLDYTKGVPQRLDALRVALERYPELRGRICLIQVLVPSREEVPQYRAMKEEIERMVGEINGRYSMPGWAPVHFTYRNLPREELIGYYLAADMALVTPLRDGMNLVAKEYAACNISGTGILCLSEFAGAAMELHRHAVMVNPFDVDGIAAAIRDGVLMDLGQRRRRMRAIRSILRRYDIFWWVDAFLQAAFSKHLEDFPPREEGYWEALEARQGPPWPTASGS